FTELSRLQAEAMGRPGQRTFRIRVDSGSSSAMIWVEKEQLFQLALAVHQLSATLRESEDSSPGAAPTENEAPPMTKLDFKAGRMVLRHDGERAMFMVDAHEIETDESEPPLMRFWGARTVMEEFAEEALRVCAAGRPLCPLCGGPMDPEGHKCPRVNGHHGRLAETEEEE
ncbi:MAG: DUF3090 family protein, partial [SAR202 cluster bacterium]|nr:DUF3090 family protein [SAR202 cluster bacterium]